MQQRLHGKCCVTQCVLGRFALGCSIDLSLWGGSFVRKGLSGSHAVFERIVVGETGPGRERAGSDLSGEGLAVIVSVLPDTSARYQRQPARDVLQYLSWRLLSLGETSVVCARPACRGRLRCMLVCRFSIAALRRGSLSSGHPAPAYVHIMATQSTCDKCCPCSAGGLTCRTGLPSSQPVRDTPASQPRSAIARFQVSSDC